MTVTKTIPKTIATRNLTLIYSLLIVVSVLDVCKLVESQHSIAANKLLRQQQVRQYDQHQQSQMKSDEYEKLSQEEEKKISDNGTLGGESKTKDHPARLVVPSNDTNSNSQVVFVNLDRVINDSGNKNESRLVDNGRLIKQDGQIACGETNRNGVPSMDSAPVSEIPNRIVGGNKADPGEFPYQVRLNIRSRRGSSLCGGVIIDQRHILTAAHCVTTW